MADDPLNEAKNLPALPDDPGEFILYQTEDGRTRVEVRVFRETVWLSLSQIADLFQRDKSVISRHIANVFEEGELDRKATVAEFATVQIEGPPTLHASRTPLHAFSPCPLRLSPR